jgi:anthranilate phosphoribosyltransferase
MTEQDICKFGKIITHLINKKNLSREEAYDAFSTVFNNQTSEIQQGAFLAALTAKGETKEEIAGCWEAIYNNDTVKVSPRVGGLIVENSGTGMDTFKTFNISTAASIIAATHNGLFLARHGARAITSKCGTVDIAEMLGVDVEGDVSVASTSLERCGLALFNGMSPKVHPNALGRILSQIAFGSTLNIAASLASPVRADIGVRGVYSREMVRPVIEAMKEIGYKKALVYFGSIDSMDKGMDEASVCGQTWCAELRSDGIIEEFNFRPEEIGLVTHKPEALAQKDNLTEEARNFVNILNNRGSKAREDAVLLNASLIFYTASKVETIRDGVEVARKILHSGNAYLKLVQWIEFQNSNPDVGLGKFKKLTGVQN